MAIRKTADGATLDAATWDAIDLACNSRLAKRPPGAISAQEYAAARGLCRQTASDRLSAAVRAGKMQRTMCVESGRVRAYFSLA